MKKLRSSGGNRAIQYFASCDPRIAITREDLDVDEHLINTPGGIVDLRTGHIRPHRREDLLSKITRYAPDANHKPRYFDRFLDDVTCGREDLQESLQRFIGSGASGVVGKALIGIATVMDKRRKSTLFESCGVTLGTYASSADMKTFASEQRAAGHSDDLASLAGVRFLRTGENTQGVRLDEGRLKRLTGGDETNVSHKGSRSFAMVGRFTLCVYTNHKPRVSGRDGGIWRRLLLFPFDWVIPEHQKDPGYREKLLDADGPYILAWILEGARKWYKHQGVVMVGDTVANATLTAGPRTSSTPPRCLANTMKPAPGSCAARHGKANGSGHSAAGRGGRRRGAWPGTEAYPAGRRAGVCLNSENSRK